MINKIRRLTSFVLIACMLLSFSSYANEEKKLNTKVSIQNSTQPGDGGGSTQYRALSDRDALMWSPNELLDLGGHLYLFEIDYIPKLEMIAIVESYDDTEFQQQMDTVMNYFQQSASYSLSYVSGKAIVSAATKLGCKKVAAAFSGVGGAIAVGFAVDAYLDFLRYVDYNAARAAIDATADNCHIRVELYIQQNYISTGDGLSMPVYLKVPRYIPYNNYIASGYNSTQGTWSSDKSSMYIYNRNF